MTDAFEPEATAKPGLWQVTRDGSFYGDYTDRTRAQRAVDAAVLEVASDGGSTKVLWAEPPGGDG